MAWSGTFEYVTDGAKACKLFTKRQGKRMPENFRMKVIDAYWELRNSGLTTCEILFEKGDSYDDYLAGEIENKFQYSVAKIPSENLALLHKLEAIGYNYIESQFNICVPTTEIHRIDIKWNKIIDEADYLKVTNVDELEIILSNINTGLFHYDRISLDEKLGRETSAIRYCNWIKDLYSDSATEIFCLLKHGNTAGFFIIRDELDKSIHSIIAGVFNKYQGQGLSVAIIYFYLKLASERNAKNVFTSFSSNNMAMLNSFTRTVSFKTLNIYYVLRRLID